MLFLHNKITSRTPGKAGNTGHGPEYHKPPPVDVPHKYRARQAASGQGGGRMPEEAQMQRESTRRQGRGNEVGPGEGAPARMAVCDTAGRKAAGGGDESAARVDASCEQPVKPRRFLTSHRPRMTGDGNGTGNPQVLLQEKDMAMSLNPQSLGNGQEMQESESTRRARVAKTALSQRRAYEASRTHPSPKPLPPHGHVESRPQSEDVPSVTS